MFLLFLVLYFKIAKLRKNSVIASLLHDNLSETKELGRCPVGN